MVRIQNIFRSFCFWMIIRYEKGKKGRQKDIRKITRNGDSREVSSSVVQ